MNRETQKLIFDNSDNDYRILLEVVHSEKEGQILRVETESKVSLKLWICDILEGQVKGKLVYEEFNS